MLSRGGYLGSSEVGACNLSLEDSFVAYGLADRLIGSAKLSVTKDTKTAPERMVEFCLFCSPLTFQPF